MPLSREQIVKKLTEFNERLNYSESEISKIKETLKAAKESHDAIVIEMKQLVLVHYESVKLNHF